LAAYGEAERAICGTIAGPFKQVAAVSHARTEYSHPTGLDAHNNRAAHLLRLVVAQRKISGGTRMAAGRATTRT
jgi:hypothetical protein